MYDKDEGDMLWQTTVLMCCFKEVEGYYEGICMYREINQCL